MPVTSRARQQNGISRTASFEANAETAAKQIEMWEANGRSMRHKTKNIRQTKTDSQTARSCLRDSKNGQDLVALTSASASSAGWG